MDKRTLIFSTAAVALMAFMVIDPAFAGASTGGDASSAGDDALTTLVDVITGKIGLILGLGITILGLWTWIIGQKTGAGIVMIIGGVLLTMAPSLFNGAHNMLSGVVDSFEGSDNAITQ
jgi:type IV secretory pathway VirB2 component (pilin)